MEDNARIEHERGASLNSYAGLQQRYDYSSTMYIEEIQS
jgi:hypothetical protein